MLDPSCWKCGCVGHVLLLLKLNVKCHIRRKDGDETSRSKSTCQLTLIDNSSTGRAGLVTLVSVAFVLFFFLYGRL